MEKPAGYNYSPPRDKTIRTSARRGPGARSMRGLGAIFADRATPIKARIYDPSRAFSLFRAAAPLFIELRARGPKDGGRPGRK